MFEVLIDTLRVVERFRDKRFLLVTGCGKSGTTWVQKILDAHPEIHCKGEGKFGYLTKGIFDAFESHKSALEMSNRIIYGKGDAFYRSIPPRAQYPIHQFAIAMVMLAGRAPIPGNVKYIGDKDPGYGFYIDTWVESAMPGCSVVHTVRDVRDVIHSMRAHRARMKPDFTGTAGELKEFVTHQATTWADIVRKVHACSERIPDRYHLVKYEALLADPAAEIASMFKNLDVACTDALVADVAAQTDFSVLSGGRALGEEDNSSFYRKGGGGDWREWLDGEYMAIVRDAAGETMAAFGYEFD